MADPYEAFIESRLCDGETERQIRDRLDDAFAPATELCQACRKRRATKLCDRLIGMEWLGDTNGMTRVYRLASRKFTCDRRICDECAVFVGRIFWNGANPGTDTTDRCPWCKGVVDRNPPAVITEDEARELRRQLWDRQEGRPSPRPL
jgi:hypothetical protein